jgi:hypothetical protein
MPALPRRECSGGGVDRLGCKGGKSHAGTMWQLNDNFVVLAAEGVLNMLRGFGYQ